AAFQLEIVWPARARGLQVLQRRVAAALAQQRVGKDYVQRRRVAFADERRAPGPCRLLVLAAGGVARTEVHHRGVEIRGCAHRAAERLGGSIQRGWTELRFREEREAFEERRDGGCRRLRVGNLQAAQSR